MNQRGIIRWLKRIKGSVRTKILVVVFIALLLPAAVLFTQGRVLLGAIAPIENEVLTKQRLRFERLASLELNDLLASARGWAIWDQFWDYFNDPRSPAWVKWRVKNIDDLVPDLHHVQLIVIADKTGRVLYAYGDPSEFAVGSDIAATDLFRAVMEKRTMAGYFRTSRGYYAVAAATVHHADDSMQQGTPNGFYLIGRKIDEAYLEETFSARLLAPVAFDVDGARTGGDATVPAGPAVDASTRSADAETLTVAFPLSNVLFDAPAPTVRITESRALYRIAYTQLLQTGVAVSIIVVSALIIIFYVFEHIVFRPLFRFLRQVEDSGSSGRLSSISITKSGDEFEHLSKTYNSMVEVANSAEEQLLVSQKFLRTVLETIRLPVVIVDRDSDRVTMVNPSGRELLVAAVGPRHWTDFTAVLKMFRTLDGRPYPAAQLPYGIAKAKGRAASSDDVLLTVNGTPTYYSVSAQPLVLSRDDRPQVLISFFDISKQREVEQLRTEFADLVAHQMRTPLTSIKWAVEAMAGASQKEQASYMGEIATTVDRTLTLINQLLTIARLAAGRLKLQIAAVPLREAVQEVTAEIRPAVLQKHLTLVLQVPPKLAAQADAGALREVLRNLLSNAVKYTPAGGTVTVSAQVGEDGAVTISVADTGIGIPPDEQPHVFERFFRASNVGAEEGTGLGLVMVRDFVDAMSGTVRFESAPGRGTIFYVRLPAPPGVA